MKRDENKLNLRNAFPEMPESCCKALMDAANSVQEEVKVKKFTIRTALIAAVIMVLTVAVAMAATNMLGWSALFHHDIPKAAQDILNATEQKTYQVGPITFTVNELLTDGHIALCSSTSGMSDGSAAVIATELYDPIGACGENGRALAEKWKIDTRTRWIDAAHMMNMPFYRVSMFMEVPEEYCDGEDMGDALWDENGNCVSYYMASLNQLKVGETLPVELHFIVSQYDPQSIEPQNVMENVTVEATELNHWDESFELTLVVPDSIMSKTYLPTKPYAFENGMTLNSVKAELTVAGAYVTGQFTLRDGFNIEEAYNGELIFRGEDDNEILWGMAESGILHYDHLPQVEWGAMLNLETLPDDLGVQLGNEAVHVFSDTYQEKPNN